MNGNVWMPHAYQFNQMKTILRQLGTLSDAQIFTSKELTVWLFQMWFLWQWLKKLSFKYIDRNFKGCNEMMPGGWGGG